MAIGLTNESEYLGVDAMAGRRITAIANHLILVIGRNMRKPYADALVRFPQILI